MNTSDSNQERKRLTALYAELNDTQLEEVADGWESLTDIARQVLQEEITRRGQDIVFEDLPALNDQAEIRRLVTIREFADALQALAAKSLLDSAGIECCLVDENMAALDWQVSSAIGGVKLRVKPDDADAAIDALERTFIGRTDSGR